MDKIAVLIGHGKSSRGGYDPGAVSGKYQEFKIAKEIGRYTKEYLNKNYEITCDLVNYKGDLNLSERIDYANKKDYDLVLEMHLNAGGGRGCEVFHSYLNGIGKDIAGEISKNVAKAFSIPDRGAKIKLNSSSRDYFGIIRQTNMPSVLIETVFIDTKSDLDKVKTSAGMKKCAKAIAIGVAKACDLSKKVVEKDKEKEYVFGFKQGDNSLGVYAYKQMLQLAKEKKLIDQGVDNNGIFGEGTAKATMQVQKMADITVNGIADKKTIQALKEKL